jgi:hypothetical membrane protein
MNKKLLKNSGIGLILLGGLGLVLIQVNSAAWYVATLIAVIGFVLFGIGGGIPSANNGDKNK